MGGYYIDKPTRQTKIVTDYFKMSQKTFENTGHEGENMNKNQQNSQIGY